MVHRTSIMTCAFGTQVHLADVQKRGDRAASWGCLNHSSAGCSVNRDVVPKEKVLIAITALQVSTMCGAIGSLSVG